MSKQMDFLDTLSEPVRRVDMFRNRNQPDNRLRRAAAGLQRPQRVHPLGAQPLAEGKKQDRYYSADPHPEAGHFYRSDHFSFAKVGVPAISFGDGNDLVNGGIARGEALGKEYIEKHYHQPSDEWSPQWDFTGMAEDVQLLHNLGRDLANSRAWLNWGQDSEFRAIA